jgi:acetate kinase
MSSDPLSPDVGSPLVGMVVLALNHGSSSIKAAVYEVRGAGLGVGDEPIAQGTQEIASDGNHERALREFVAALACLDLSGASIDAVGHRVVHGGRRFTESVLLTPEREAELAGLDALAPLHNAPSLAGIRVARTIFGPDVPMIAVFDTAFHADMPERAWRYAIPADFTERHDARRFGFHGLSYRSVLHAFEGVAGVSPASARIVALHLGSGCSATAIANGRSIDTSMGLTPLEGLVMGTRSGDVDPALVGHLSRRERVPVETVEAWLNRRSGLLGLSGLSADVRVLLERAAEHSGARLALEVFCYRARKTIGAYVAALGGIDAVVFTGGIGEHAPPIRAGICEGLGAFGIELDAERNANAIGTKATISPDGARVGVYVIPSDEERVIAAEAARVLNAAGSPPSG